MATRHDQITRAQCVTPRCRRPLLNTDKGQLGLIWSSQTAIQVERHHSLCLHFAARNSHSFQHFQLFNIWILPTTTCHPSILTYSFNILTPAVAHHGRSDAPEALFTSVLCGCCCSHRCRQILTVGGKILALRTCSRQSLNATDVTWMEEWIDGWMNGYGRKDSYWLQALESMPSRGER